MHPAVPVEHQAPEVELAELLTTQLAATEPQMELVVRQQTGAAAVAAERQLPAPMRFLLVVMAATDGHPQSPELQQHMQVVAAAAAVTPAFPAVHPPLAVTAEQVAAETADPPRGMEHTVVQALVSAAQQIPGAVEVAVVTARPISAEPLTAVAATVALASLSCVTCFPLLQLPTLRLHQTVEHQQPTTSQRIAH